MTVTYNVTTINNRLTQVVNAIGSSGLFILTDASSNTLSTIQLSTGVGTIAAGVLTFSGTPLSDPSAAGTGTAALAKVTTGAGTVIISGLTVSSAGGGGDVVLTPTAITAGQTVVLSAATITGR